MKIIYSNIENLVLWARILYPERYLPIRGDKDNQTHQGLNMPVAVKMLKHDMAMNPHFLESFRRKTQIILTSCAIDPAKRYASAGEALLAIEKLTPKLQIQTEDDKRMLTSVLMVYQEKDRQALRRLLEKFTKGS